jgi:hypothetical protein
MNKSSFILVVHGIYTAVRGIYPPVFTGDNCTGHCSNPPDSDDTIGEGKKEVKTGQQSMGVGDNNVGLDGPNHKETNSGDGNDDVLDENKNNEGGKDVCNDTNNVGKFCDADNGDGDNSDGIVNNIGGNDSNYVGNPPDSGDAVGERIKNGKTVQQSKGGGDDNVRLDGSHHKETNSGDGYDNVLGGNRKKEGGKDVGNDYNIFGKTCDGDDCE